jgi:hypothetical protein
LTEAAALVAPRLSYLRLPPLPSPGSVLPPGPGTPLWHAAGAVTGGAKGGGTYGTAGVSQQHRNSSSTSSIGSLVPFQRVPGGSTGSMGGVVVGAGDSGDSPISRSRDGRHSEARRGSASPGPVEGYFSGGRDRSPAGTPSRSKEATPLLKGLFGGTGNSSTRRRSSGPGIALIDLLNDELAGGEEHGSVALPGAAVVAFGGDAAVLAALPHSTSAEGRRRGASVQQQLGDQALARRLSVSLNAVWT